MKYITMMSIAEVSSLIKNKKISPVEVVDESLKRTNILQDKLNVYITFLADEARATAKIAEQEIMKDGPKSLLHGIPIALKDLFFTKGILTSAGSQLLADFKPDYNGTITERLHKSGSILMGKTNLHEWAFGPTNEVSYYGPSYNPWDTSRITGGSIRIPAALCGVVGFKPTFGLASLYGIVPLSFNLDHPGPLTRSVIDAAITMDIITGYDLKDPCPRRYKGGNTNFAEALKNVDNMKGMTIGIPSNFYFDKVDYEVEKLVKKAISAFKELGATVKFIKIPYLDVVPDVSTIIMSAEAALAHKDRLAVHPDGYKPDVKARLELGMSYSAIDYIKALQDREKIINAWEDALFHVDVVVTPTLPITAFKIGSTSVFTRGKEEPARKMCVRHTHLANMTGSPALTVPCGLTSDGLPVGVMIMGRNHDDLTVMKIGYAYEKHNPYIFKQF